MRRSFSFVIAVAIAFAVITAATAQSGPGRIQGVVRDTSGGILPGVTVTLARDTIQVQQRITDANGAFEFLDVAPGAYTVTAELRGFRTTTLTAVVETGATRQLAIALAVGALQETVTVTGAAPVVDTQSVRSEERRV